MDGVGLWDGTDGQGNDEVTDEACVVLWCGVVGDFVRVGCLVVLHFMSTRYRGS